MLTRKKSIRKHYPVAGVFVILVALIILCIRTIVDRPPLKLTAWEAEHVTHIKTGKTTPLQLVTYAAKFSGTPYKYGSTDPGKGFDCSGFVTYVFKHFHISVPRTTADFAPVDSSIRIKNAKLGDILIFTGSDSTTHVAGHMGIISSLPGEPLRFLHASSGKKPFVVESGFTGYYQHRYLKTIRLFPQNNKVGMPI